MPVAYAVESVMPRDYDTETATYCPTAAEAERSLSDQSGDLRADAEQRARCADSSPRSSRDKSV